MFRRMILGSFVLAFGTWAVVAAAEDAPVQQVEKQEKAGRQSPDTDGDKKISREEFKAAWPDRPADLFDKRDTNKDGFITREDRQGAGAGRTREANKEPARDEGGERAGKLHQADKDGDKKISLEEFKAALPEATEERFKALDRNGDGVISQEDRQAGPKGESKARETRTENWDAVRDRLITTADKDGDKKASLEEVQAAKPGFTEAAFKRHDSNGDGFVGPDDSAPARPEGGIAARLRQADTDKDRKVSLEEAQEKIPELTAERFKSLDKNGDGFLSPEDRKPVKESSAS